MPAAATAIRCHGWAASSYPIRCSRGWGEEQQQRPHLVHGAAMGLAANPVTQLVEELGHAQGQPQAEEGVRGEEFPVSRQPGDEISHEG